MEALANQGVIRQLPQLQAFGPGQFCSSHSLQSRTENIVIPQDAVSPPTSPSIDSVRGLIICHNGGKFFQA